MYFIESIDTSTIATSVGGVTTDGKYLWLAMQGPNKVVCIAKDGTLIKDLGAPLGGIEMSDLTFMGKDLYIQGRSVDRLYQVSRDGVVIREINYSSASPDGHGIDNDGKNFWVADNSYNAMRCIDRDGKLVRSIGAPDSTPLGIALDGKDFYLTGYNKYRSYHLDRDGTVIQYWALSALGGYHHRIDIDGKDVWGAAAALGVFHLSLG